MQKDVDDNYREEWRVVEGDFLSDVNERGKATDSKSGVGKRYTKDGRQDYLHHNNI